MNDFKANDKVICTGKGSSDGKCIAGEVYTIREIIGGHLYFYETGVLSGYWYKYFRAVEEAKEGRIDIIDTNSHEDTITWGKLMLNRVKGGHRVRGWT